MSNNFRFAQLQQFSLSGSGAIAGATSITLKSMTAIDGSALSMAADFGTKGFGTLQPNEGTSEESISFTGLVNNSNGTVTLTGVSNVSFLYPYTETSGLSKTHPGSTTFIISNTSGFYNRLDATDNDETITATYTFTVPNYPRVDNASTLPTDDAQLATKKYVDGVAIAGAPDASSTVKGISKLSINPVSPTAPIAVGDNDPRVPTVAQVGYIPTSGQKDALVGNNTSIAVGSGNKYVTQAGLQNGAETYAASIGSANAYVLTLSPVPTALVAGQRFSFKANFTNTGAATLNVNSLGAIAIKKGDGATDLSSGDITSGQIVVVEYDGTNFQMTNKQASNFNYAIGSSTPFTSTTAQTSDETITVGFKPRLIKIYYYVQGYLGGAGLGASKGTAFYNGTTLINNIYQWGQDSFGVRVNSDNAAPNVGTAGLNPVGFLIQTNPIDTTDISAGDTNNNNYNKITVTINSVSATGFVIRKVTTIGGSGAAGNALFQAFYEVYE